MGAKQKIGAKAVYPTVKAYSGICVIYFDNIPDGHEVLDSFNTISNTDMDSLIEWLELVKGKYLESEYFAFMSMETFVDQINSEELSCENFQIIPLSNSLVRKLKIELL